MFSTGLGQLRFVFEREGPLLRLGVCPESEWMQVAGGPVEECPDALAGVIVAVALAAMGFDLREGTARAIQVARS